MHVFPENRYSSRVAGMIDDGFEGATRRKFREAGLWAFERRFCTPVRRDLIQRGKKGRLVRFAFDGKRWKIN